METYEYTGKVTAKPMTRIEMDIHRGIDVSQYPSVPIDNDKGFFVVVDKGEEDKEELWYPEEHFHSIFTKV